MGDKEIFHFGEVVDGLMKTAPQRNGFPYRKLTAKAVASEIGMANSSFNEIVKGYTLPGMTSLERAEKLRILMESLSISAETSEGQLLITQLIRDTLQGFPEEYLRLFAAVYDGDENLAQLRRSIVRTDI